MRLPKIAFIFLLFFLQTALAQEKNPAERQVIYSDGGHLIRKPIVLPKPEYPPAAKAVGASGTVNVEITIDENGDVLEAKAISGHPLLWAESVKSALKSKWKPVELSGKPVKVSGILVFNYNIDGLAQIRKAEDKTPPNKIPKGKTIIDLAGGIVIGKPVKLFKPPFPVNCRCKFSKDKKVVVKFTVDKDGNVESATAIAGHPLLRAQAETAIRNSKFSVSSVNGMPVEMFGFIIYDYFFVKNRWRTRVVKYDFKIRTVLS